MRRWVVVGGAAASACPILAAAQTAPAPVATAPAASAPVPAPDTASQAVIAYPPAFFAASNPSTALDMIARLPGFSLDIGDVGARGLAGNAGNVLIDGSRPASKSDTLDEVLGRIAANSVERIELIRGGAPGIDMRGRAVVANVVLKKTASRERVLDGNASLYSNGAVAPSLTASYTRREGERQTELSLSATSDRAGLTGRGLRSQTGASGDAIQTAALDFRDRYVNVDARGAVERPFLAGKLHANLVLAYQRFHDTQATVVTAGAGDDEFVRERTAYPNGEAGFTWTRSAGPRTTIELTGLQRLNRNTYRGAFDGGAAGGPGSTFASVATGSESVARATDTFRANPKLTFEGGGELAYNALDSSSRYATDGEPVALPNDVVRVSELRGEGFAQATWQPSGKLTVDGTMRIELSRIAQTGDVARARGFTYPKPKLLVTWLPGTGHQLRLRVEQEVGQLDFGDFAASSNLALGTVTGGNADLRPSRTLAVEGVYERRFWKKAVFMLTLRHSELSDVIDLVPLAGGIDAIGNIGGGTSDVARVALTLPFDRFGVKEALLKLDAGARRSRVIDPLTGEPRRLASQQPFDCSVSYTHDLAKGRFSYGFDHSCNVNRYRQYRTTEFQVFREPPSASLYGQWKPGKDLTLRLTAGNLVDGARATIRDVYDGPRDTAPLLFHEDRATRSGRYLNFQVRRVL